MELRKNINKSTKIKFKVLYNKNFIKKNVKKNKKKYLIVSLTLNYFSLFIYVSYKKNIRPLLLLIVVLI